MSLGTRRRAKRSSVHSLHGSQQVRAILLILDNSFSQIWLAQVDGERACCASSLAGALTHGGRMEYRAISLVQKFGLLHERWQPKVIAEMNDYQFKVVKLQGDFIWHHHKDTDETFIVIEGDLRIDFRDGAVHVRAERCSSSRKGWSTNRTPNMRSSCF